MYYVDPIIKDFLRINQPEGRAPYIRLDQNENPDGLPKWLFKKAMKKITPEYLSLYPEEIAFTEKYANHLGLKAENITFTVGSVVAMGYVIKVFGEPGKDLVSVTPTFGMYKVYADMQKINTVFIRYENDYTFNINKLLDAINSKTTIVSLVNPSMPIGNVYSPEDIEKIVVKAKKYNAIVIIDEAYHYFYKETSIELIKKYENVIILRTFSKMLSIPSLRMGIVISSQKNIQYIKNYKPHYTINGVALAFAETIIDNYNKVIFELNKKFTAGRDYLLKELDKSCYKYIPSYGCFICITPKHKTPEYITDELKKKNILIFCGKGDSAGFLRVTIWDKKYMKIFIENLKEIDR